MDIWFKNLILHWLVCVLKTDFADLRIDTCFENVLNQIVVLKLIESNANIANEYLTE